MTCPKFQTNTDPACCSVIPTVPAGVPTARVNPCPIDGKACTPCVDVCVPVIEPTIPAPAPPAPRKKKCKYIQPPRPLSYAPNRKFAPPCVPMEDDTTYTMSYIPSDIQRPNPIIPDPNLCVGEGKMPDCTIHRKSFQPHCGVLLPCPIFTCEHKLTSDGPMQDITTNKHDYVPKPFMRQGYIKNIA